MSRRNQPVLPGLSRSAACLRPVDGTKCRRLTGHHGDCRPALAATKSPITVGTIIALPDGTKCRVVEVHPVVAAPKRMPAKARRQADPEGVEVLSFDRYTVQPERQPKAARPAAAKAAAKQRCRVVKAGVRCARAYGHKQAGIRHAFGPSVRVIAEVPADRSQVIRGKSSRRRNFVASSAPSARLA